MTRYDRSLCVYLCVPNPHLEASTVNCRPIGASLSCLRFIPESADAGPLFFVAAGDEIEAFSVKMAVNSIWEYCRHNIILCSPLPDSENVEGGVPWSSHDSDASKCRQLRLT